MKKPNDFSPGEPLEITLCCVKSVFRYCPPGAFMMGSPIAEKGRFHWERRHKVILTKGFWILETPVTQELWRAATGDNPSRFKGDRLPVETVSWDDCAQWTASFNSKGEAPKGFKLDFPTDAEWEYACRAGTTTRYNFGDEMTSADANFDGNVGATSPVKTYKPNAWGLYDMHGNVCEWVSDWFEKNPSQTVTDPVGPTTGASRVNRGGGWSGVAEDCRSASRGLFDPTDKTSSIGFRIVLRASN